jgi:hypothetical protein
LFARVVAVPIVRSLVAGYGIRIRIIGWPVSFEDEFSYFRTLVFYAFEEASDGRGGFFGVFKVLPVLGTIQAADTLILAM